MVWGQWIQSTLKFQVRHGGQVLLPRRRQVQPGRPVGAAVPRRRQLGPEPAGVSGARRGRPGPPDDRDDQVAAAADPEEERRRAPRSSAQPRIPVERSQTAREEQTTIGYEIEIGNRT